MKKRVVQIALDLKETPNPAQSSPNPNVQRLGSGEEGKVCGECVHLIDRGGKRFFNTLLRRFVTSHKWRCRCAEGSKRDRAWKHEWQACIYFAEKGQVR